MSNAKKSIVVGEHFEAFIDEQVSSGRYNNASEVVRAGLRLLERDELQLTELRRLIEEGDADIRSGRFHEYDTAESLLDDIVRRSESGH
ncbi:antitoxin ParD1/3/4 [Rhizobium subbaraonis]|uniref:Antitoxin ParD1/3/4 n=1 Tax=Rhizobium subbaraonis TaxID=908946 RepID=A0A285UD04_9HYPH|nr:type II toxin-antitoxin system ParD family antitoxin [Rhizobium subbaraonis]SOC39804.1 antitoxin ParD1/3/4 [Rhizobium subbaraonis]